MKKYNIFIAFFLPIIYFAQTYTPGTIYYGTDGFTEYHAGNMPLIISAPHGGYLIPTSIPDRNCIGCVTVKDSYTQELTLDLQAAIKAKTNCFPHVIINNLHRKKLDANREIIEATDSNPSSYVYWEDYNNFIDSARINVIQKTTKGLFIDIHGHGHTIQRLEIGYLFNTASLQYFDSHLNTTSQVNKSSIKNLSNNNLLSLTHAELLRGQHSLGSMLWRKGFPSVPSDSIPFPLTGEPFFAGGYNTAKWGSRDNGEIDAIQIEHNQSIRFTSSIRQDYTDSLADVLLNYLEKHYFANYKSNYCFTNNLKEIRIKEAVIYPNPTKNKLNIQSALAIKKIIIYDFTGKLIKEISKTTSIDISKLKSSVYFLKIIYENSKISSFHKVIKK